MESLQDLYLTYQSTLAYIGINALLALSVYTTLSCGQLALSIAGFVAIGAYAASILTLNFGASFPVALLVATVLPPLVAVPLGLPVLRIRGVFLAIATVAFGEVVRVGLVNWDYVNGAQGLVAIPQKTSVWMIYLAVAAALALLWRLKGSKWGFALEAIREDEAAARTMGIDTTALQARDAGDGRRPGRPRRRPRGALLVHGGAERLRLRAGRGHARLRGGRRDGGVLRPGARRGVPHAPPRGAPRGGAAPRASSPGRCAPS